ncbi:MAG: nucleotide exchange factor GrpE [Kiritimatiellae bacterium]|nr:nucleotide exchange factor GrpE [Kiritimatiellia bacterium]
MNSEIDKKDEVASEATAEVKEPKAAEGEAQAVPEEAAADGAAESAEKEPKAAEKAEKPVEPDWKDHYARLLADFDNFKKRTQRDREDIFRYAESDILKDFLPVVDNLSLALSTTANKEDPFVKGVQLVYDTFLNALKDHGAEPFDSVGLELDTEKMDAIAQLPSDTVEEGKVSNEAKRGWMLKGKVLRAAQVVVSSGKAS